MAKRGHISKSWSLKSLLELTAYSSKWQKRKHLPLCVSRSGSHESEFLSDKAQGLLGGTAENHPLIFQNISTGHTEPGWAVGEMPLMSHPSSRVLRTGNKTRTPSPKASLAGYSQPLERLFPLTQTPFPSSSTRRALCFKSQFRCSLSYDSFTLESE